MHLAALFIHPVKSLRGIEVASAEVDALGAVGDRRFLVVDPGGNFLTQRTVPRMALVGAFLDESTLTLRCAGLDDLPVRRSPDPGAPLVSVRVWKSDGLQAEDCGEGPAAWLTRALGGPCRLVRIGAAFSRQILKKAAHPGDLVGFADSCPFLATSEASLGELNRRIAEAGAGAVPMGRFRPNLVLSGCGPFDEDSWTRLRIGEIVFRSAGPCSRCVITVTDQLTGERGVEPLRTLASFRRDPLEPTDVNFGTNLLNETKGGVLRVGDPVTILD
jgi:MOSC domain-containing protein